MGINLEMGVCIIEKGKGEGICPYLSTFLSSQMVWDNSRWLRDSVLYCSYQYLENSNKNIMEIDPKMGVCIIEKGKGEGQCFYRTTLLSFQMAQRHNGD